MSDFSNILHGFLNGVGHIGNATKIGRAIHNADQQDMNDARAQAAYNAFTQHYGPEAGAPEQYQAFEANRRANTTQDQATAADLRARQTSAQRSGIGMMRSILQLPEEQQQGALQQFAPVIARAYGTDPDEIVGTYKTLRQSQDPTAALDALDQSLETPDERAARAAQSGKEDLAAQNNEADMEIARIGANSRENVANTVHGRTALNPQALAIVNRTRQTTIANALQQIDIMERSLDEGSSYRSNDPLAIMERTALSHAGPGFAEGRFAAAAQAIQGINIATELQSLAASGVHPGRQASSLTEKEGQALANIGQMQDPHEIRQALARARRMYEALSSDLEDQAANGAPTSDTAPSSATDGNTPAPADDPLATFYGAH